MFSMTRRAGWAHPNSKSNTVSGKSSFVNMRFLPDGTIYSKSYPRKWIQIQIWTDGPQCNLHFKSLALPLCCRPSFWRFPNTVLLFELGCAHPALRVTGNIEIIEKWIEEPKSRLPDPKKRLPSKISRLSFFSARGCKLCSHFHPR